MSGLMIFETDVREHLLVRHIGAVLRRDDNGVDAKNLRPSYSTVTTDLPSGRGSRGRGAAHPTDPRVSLCASMIGLAASVQRSRCRQSRTSDPGRRRRPCRHPLRDVARLLVNGRQGPHVSASNPNLARV